eukprot:CAMPEP_0114520796 /NCGR_PEP_ID=MMETSP0109-20121206/19820_1 /TAXON_ID=29199 /ORGANISM="Chlorarachnion reptans, Strain CCCM449" /LENGTH=165 /DNA_ID=CAMNT_0001701811 /DNA_START=376 /DNA_END=873 /DNA_ORIENTATION=+
MDNTFIGIQDEKANDIACFNDFNERDFVSVMVNVDKNLCKFGINGVWIEENEFKLPESMFYVPVVRSVSSTAVVLTEAFILCNGYSQNNVSIQGDRATSIVGRKRERSDRLFTCIENGNPNPSLLEELEKAPPVDEEFDWAAWIMVEKPRPIRFSQTLMWPRGGI